MHNNEPLISTETFIESLKVGIEESDSRILEVIDFESKGIENEIDVCLYPDKINARFSDLVNQNFPDKKDIFYKTVNFIEEKHEGQFRDENTPYYCHLIMSAIYCFENGGGENEVLASLLHDILEDTPVKYNELVELFGEDVANIVKLVSFSVDGEIVDEEVYYKNIKNSPSALLVKGSDRLSNMYSTMFTQDQEWKNGYYDRTKNQVIPLIQELYPDLAGEINAVIIYLENHSLPEEQEKRISDLKRIKEIKEKLRK